MTQEEDTELRGGGWSVWRQDDNGNEVVVRSGLTEAEARALAAQFEARGHKQMYWVEPDE